MKAAVSISPRVSPTAHPVTNTRNSGVLVSPRGIDEAFRLYGGELEYQTWLGELDIKSRIFRGLSL